MQNVWLGLHLGCLASWLAADEQQGDDSVRFHCMGICLSVPAAGDIQADQWQTSSRPSSMDQRFPAAKQP